MIVEKHIPVEKPVFIDKYVEVVKKVPVHIDRIIEKEVPRNVYVYQDKPDTLARMSSLQKENQELWAQIQIFKQEKDSIERKL